MELTICLFLLSLPCLLADGDMHFAGGCMMFKFIKTNETPYKIKITAMTGWVLGKGPCGTTCSAANIGTSTHETRQQIINRNGETYLGNWTKEYGSTSDKFKSYKMLNNDVASTIVGQVAAVNVPMKWEQELAEIIIDIDPTQEYTDISLHGSYWRKFDYTYGVQKYPVPYRLQIKVKPTIREDTKKPNNSPVAMFKPVYKILLNNVTTIKLSTMDEDGDFIVCSLAEFVEAGGLATLNNTQIKQDCSIVINPQESAGFIDGGWGAIPIKVNDVPTKRKSNIQASDLLSTINVQFMIQTLKTINAPEFVDPTEKSQHLFNVYAGTTLKIPLYAKPMESSVNEIYEFNLRSIPPRTFHVDKPIDDTKRKEQHVKYSIVKWSPQPADVGEFVFSALVTDTAGSDCLDRNYNILVKDMILFPERNVPHTGPYFPLFPRSVGIVCMIGSTCSFPIYTKTHSQGGVIESVKFTTSTFSTTDITPPEQITRNKTTLFVSAVTVHASKPGEQRICFEATDSKGARSEIKCLGVEVKLPDPCKLHPCETGICKSEGQSYVCNCPYGKTGKNCEIDIDFCESKPCMNNGKCSSTKTAYFCDCSGTGYLGLSCQTDKVDCKPGVCGTKGVCKDLKGNFECECYNGYSDHCQKADIKCNGVTCQNGGFCIVEEGVGVCKCPLGFAGDDCQDENAIPPVNSETKIVSFTVPSLPNGAEIQCFVGRTCNISMYSEKPNTGTPDVHIGLHSPWIEASVVSSDLDPTTDTIKSIVTVTPSKVGLHTVCVNSASANPDTLCYKVNAKALTLQHLDASAVPAFRPPTPPDGSIINCIQRQPCHTVITTDFNPFSHSCSMYSGSTSAIVFQVLKQTKICETNVLFNPPASGDKEVCLQAGPLQKVSQRLLQGERRCFTIKTATKDECNPNPCNTNIGGACILQPGETPPYQCICPDSATGDHCQHQNPCVNTPCKNDAFCEPEDDEYECICPVGYEGKDCDQKVASTTEAEFTDTSMKTGATIECEVGKPCVIPMYTKGPSSQLVNGPQDGDVDVKLTQPVRKAGTNINEGQLEVTPNTPGVKKVCVKSKSDTTKSDEILCYHIKTKIQGEILGTDNFESPSLPSGSIVKCPEKIQCHLIMHSKPDGTNNCPQVKEDEVGKVDFHIFSTKLESGSCVTDVVVKPTSATDLQKFCLKARDQDNPRCFKVDPDTKEPCETKHCGSGNCIVEPDHSAACVCDDTHSGAECEEAAPCKSSPCHNSAVCEKTGATFQCHCSVGYKGTLCDQTTDVPSISKPSFTKAIISSGSTFNCVKGKVCKIPISIAKPDAPRPVLEPGPHDKGVTVTVPNQPSKDSDILGRSDLYKGYVDVTPSETGDKKVCVNTGHTSSTRQSMVDDTVCYHLHVTDTDTGAASTDSFQEPTPRGGSQIRCVPNEDCHFLVHSKPEGGKCPQVAASSGKVNVFPSRKDVTFTDCITDLSVSASELTGSPKTICLKARLDKPERCFQVSSKPPTDPCIARGCGRDNVPCILEKNDSATCVCEEGSTLESCLVKCENGGKRDSNHDCQCTLGFSGTTCEEGPKENLGGKPKYADNNIANGGTIKCIIDQKCTFPIYAQSGQRGTTSPKVSPAVKSPDVDVSVETPTKLTPSTGVPGLYSAPVSVTAHKEGMNKVCLKLEEADKTSVCYNIEVTDGSTPTKPTKFISPTLPEGSHIKCETEECHLLVHTKEDPACAQVTLPSGGGVAFKTKEKGSECITDVMYKPTTSSRELCIGSGASSDERCYKVQKSTDSCAFKECSDGSACLISGTHPECVCEPGMTGSKCETDIDKCSNGGKDDGTGKCKCPLGYSGDTCSIGPTGNTDFKPKYADNNMLNGGTIKCEKDEECTFPVYTNVPNTDQTSPLVTKGPSSPNVEVRMNPGTDLNKETAVPGLYKTPVIITPHKSGPSKVCLELSKADEKSVCYNIDVTDASTKPKQTTFLEPTLPDESSVLCKTECHMLVHTKPDPNCKQVTTSDSTDTVFNTKKVGTECVTDILYKAETTDKKLCINSGSHSEQRCYHVKKSIDPCSSKTCNNDGACVNDGSTGKCVCKPGFEGVSCDQSQGGCQNGGKEAASGKCVCPIGFTTERCKAVEGNTGSEPKFAQSSLDNGGTIKCITGQPCIFPVEALLKDGSNNPPVLSTGPTSGDIHVDIDPPQPIGDKTKVPDMYSIPVTLKATEPGTKKICLKLDGGRKNGVCYSVDVSNEVNPGSSVESLFLPPTLPAQSTVPCKDEHCHMIVHTKPDLNTGCKQVTTDNVENKAFTTVMTEDGKECLTDVAFSKEATSGSQLCINARSAGEKRCYAVKNSNKFADPCKTETCSDHGMCLRKETDSECVCDEGYTGDICQTSVAKSLGVDIKKPHIIEPTITNGFLLQCEDGKPCKIRVVATAGSPGSTLEKPEVDGTDTGSSTPVRNSKGNFYTDVTIPLGTGPKVTKHCITLKTSSGIVGDPWCVLINRKPSSTSLTPHTDKFQEPTLPDGSVIPCTIGTTCTIPVTTDAGKTLKDSTGIDIPHTVETDNNENKIKISPTDTDKGDHEVCVEISTESSGKRCYTVRVQQNPDALAKDGASLKPGGTSTPDTSTQKLKKPKVIGPSPMNGTTVTCNSAGCHLKLIVETPQPSTGGGLDVTSTGTSGAISKISSTKISPNQHSIDVTLKPDPTGPDHQTMCMEVTMSSTTSSPWCVDVNVDKSGSSSGSSTSPTEVTEPTVPCYIGSTCIIPVTTPLSSPLLTSTDKSASVQGSALSPDGKTFTHIVAVTPSSSVPSLQKICLKEKASQLDVATVRKCVNIEVLSEVKPTVPEVKPTEPKKVIAQGLGVDTREPHVLKPTLTSGTIIPCETSCQVDVVVDPGNQPDGGVELVPTNGAFNTTDIVATPDGKYKIKLDITPGTSTDGLQPVCFKVKNKGTGHVGDEWCTNLNPKPDKSKNPPTPSGSNGKDIVSTSLPPNTELTCTVGTTCSVDIKTAPGTGAPIVTTPGPLNPTVTTDTTDPHEHTLSLTPTMEQIGEHKVCVKVKSKDVCYNMKITPNPKDIGIKGDGSPSNNPDVPCGANDHVEIAGPTDTSTVDCASTGCSFHVLVKPPACSKGSKVKINPETPGQISQGPVSSVGSLKDIVVNVPQSSGGPSGEVCMSPDMEPSLPGKASRYCVTLERSTPSSTSKDGNIGTLKLVKCELESECVIPIATTPDRLLSGSPEVSLLAPTIMDGQSLQPVVYHAKSPGKHQLCLNAEKTSNSDDIKPICTTIEVTLSETTTAPSTSATTQAPGTGTAKDFIKPEQPDLTKPHVLEPSSTPGSTIQCYAGSPCNIPLVVDTGASGSPISEVLVNKEKVDPKTSNPLSGNKYSTAVPISTSELKTGMNPRCIEVKTSTKESDPYCVYVNYQPKKLSSATTSPDVHLGLDLDHSLPKESVIECVIGKTCSIPFTEKSTDPFKSVDATVPNKITQPNKNNPLEKIITFTPSVGTYGTKKVCIRTESQSESCYALHVKTSDISGSNPSSSGSGNSGSNPVVSGSGNSGSNLVGSGSGNSGSNPVGSGSGNSGSNPVDSGSGNSGSNPVGSGSGNSGSNPVGSGSGNSGSNPVGSGSGNSGSNPVGSGSGNSGSNPVVSGSGNSGSNPVVSGSGNSGSNLVGSINLGSKPSSSGSGNSGSNPVGSGSGNSGSNPVGSGSGNSGSNPVGSGSGNSGSNPVGSGSGNSGSNPNSSGSGNSGSNPVGSGSGNSGLNPVGSGSGNSGSNPVGSGSGNSGSNPSGSGSGNSGSNPVGSGSGNSGSNPSGSGSGNSGSNPVGSGSGNSGSNPSSSGSGSGGSQTHQNSGKNGVCPVLTVHNKPKIISPSDGSRIECSLSECEIQLQVDSQFGGMEKVSSEGRDLVLISSIPITHGSYIVMTSLTPSSDKACVKVVEDHCHYSSDSVCFFITHSNEITGQLPAELKGHSSSSQSVQPIEVKCLEGSSCSIIIPTDSTRPYLLPTDNNTQVPNKVMTPDHSKVLHEVVVPSGSVGSHSVCLDSMATVFDKSPEKICFHMETVSPVSVSQCSSKPLSKTVAMKAYGGGGMVCTCNNGAVKTVMKPPVSNGQLLRVAGLGFGAGIGIQAIGALVYLAITKIQSMSKEKSKKDLYDMGFN